MGSFSCVETTFVARWERHESDLGCFDSRLFGNDSRGLMMRDKLIDHALRVCETMTMTKTIRFNDSEHPSTSINIKITVGR